MNFIDGLNGLAGGVAFIAAGFLAGIAATHDGWFAYAASLLLAAGIAGFLPFNFPRARIFMGDVGSQFCGFMLAVLAVVASRFQGLELSFLLVPMLLSGVLFDVGLHAGAPRAGRRAPDRAASRPPVPGRAARRRARPGGGADPLDLRGVWRGLLPGVHISFVGVEAAGARLDPGAAAGVAGLRGGARQERRFGAVGVKASAGCLTYRPPHVWVRCVER